MSASVVQEDRYQPMLPLFLMSDVDVDQQGPFKLGTFPSAMFFTQLGSNSLPTLSKSKQNQEESAKQVESFHRTLNKLNSTSMTSSKTNHKLSSQNDAENVLSKQLNVCSLQHNKNIHGQTRNEKQVESPKNLDNIRHDPYGSQPSAQDPCVGLTDYIRTKDKKRFVCGRCGSTHSNCVKAKRQINTRELQLRKQRLSRSRSVNSTSNKKTISICPNCGKRSHTSAIGEIDFYRSLTWPVPLERIVEDEEGCCLTQECSCVQNLSAGKMFQPLFSRAESHCKDENIQQQVYEKLQQESLTSALNQQRVSNAGVNKVLIVNICRPALAYVQSMRKWSIEKFGNVDLIHFVAMVTKHNMKSQPELLRAMDSYVNVDTSLQENFNEENVILEAAQSHKVQAVWIDGFHRARHDALQKMLHEAGILLLTSSTPNMFDATSSPQSNHSSQGDIESFPHLSHLRCNNKVDSRSDKVNNRILSDDFSLAALLSAAVHVAELRHRARSDQYLAALNRKEILPGDALVSFDCVEMCHHAGKYGVNVARISESCYYLSDGEWSAEVGVNRLSDDGLLLSIGGATYRTYLQETRTSFYVDVDKKVYELGKIDVPNHELCNGHSLNVELPKTSSLHPSSFDEVSASSSLTRTNGHRQLPKIETPKHNSKISNGNTDLLKDMDSALHSLSHVMKGWCHPVEIAKKKIEENVRILLASLNDPTLPLLQMQDAIASMGGCLPPPVERGIGKEMYRYASNITSMMILFPGARIKKIVEYYAKSLTNKSDEDAFHSSMRPVVEVVERFSNGIRGHMRETLLSLLREYHRVEAKFQGRSFQESVLSMLSDADASTVMNDIRSHLCVSQKNCLALHLINSLTDREQNLKDDVKSLLADISALSSEQNAKVALKARQVVRRAGKTPYELRYNQLDSIFLSLMSSCDENLMKSISDVDTFELLPQFFCHNKAEVRMAALEIYARRAYTSCQLLRIQHQQVSDNNSAIVLNYAPSSGKDCKSDVLSPNRFSNSSFSSCSEAADDQHVALVTAFPNLDQFERCIPDVLHLLDFPLDSDYRDNFLDAKSDSYKKDDGCEQTSSRLEPARTLHVTMTAINDVADDDAMCQILQDFLTMNKVELNSVDVQRIVFLIHRRNKDVKYFVFNSSGENFLEDEVLRHVEPALASELGLDKMQDRDLQSLPSHHGLHIFLETNCVKNDEKILVKTLVRNENVETQQGVSPDLLCDDVEVALLEALDDLDDLPTNVEKRRKHIEINVIKNVDSDVEEVGLALKVMVLGYWERLWKNNAREIQVSARTRSCDDSISFNVHLLIEDENQISIRQQ